MERTISPANLQPVLGTTLVLDVRRDIDYAASAETVPGSTWRDPGQIDGWIAGVPKDKDVVIYCARGGSVSNSVVDRLHAEGVKARFIEGGIEGWKAAGGALAPK